MKIIDYIHTPMLLSPGADTISDSVKECYNMVGPFLFSADFLLSAATLSLFSIYHLLLFIHHSSTFLINPSNN